MTPPATTQGRFVWLSFPDTQHAIRDGYRLAAESAGAEPLTAACDPTLEWQPHYSLAPLSQRRCPTCQALAAEASG